MRSFRFAALSVLTMVSFLGCTAAPRDGDSSPGIAPTCTQTDAGEPDCSCPEPYVLENNHCRARNACELTVNGGCDPTTTCEVTATGKSCLCAGEAIDAGQPCTTAGELSASTHYIDFASTCVTGTAKQTLVLSNVGTQPLNITALEVQSAAFALVPSPTLPLSIAAGDSTTLTIAFKPTNTGSSTGALIVTSNGRNPESNSQTILLLGSGYQGEGKHFEVSCLCERGAETTCGLANAGAGTAADRPCNFLSFDNVVSNTTLERVVRLENSGCGSLEVHPSFAGNSEETAYFSAGASGTITLQAGETKDLTVRFAPTGNAPIYPDVQLKLISDDPGLRQGQTIAGTWSVMAIANSVVE